MNRNSLIKRISKRSGLKKKKCEDILNFMSTLMAKELSNKRELMIDGFGNFNISHTRLKWEKFGNKFFIIPPSDIPRFTPSEELLNKTSFL